MKNKLAYLFALVALPVLANTPPVITNVRASQREGTKLVDIYYDAADVDNDALKVRIEISDNDGAKYSVPAFSLTGDIGEGITPGTGKHIVWDAGTDWDGEYSDQMRVKVYAIDAQGFPGMEWGNEVPPGGFLMGQDGGAEGSGPSRHVNIPWSYWLGKYEVTCQQYCDFLNAALVSGFVQRNGTTGVKTNSGMLPGINGECTMISLGDNQRIRWNVNNFEVVGTYSNFPVIVTWYGAFAFCRYYGYDLPTEAEWEKAARGPDHDDQDEHLLYPWGNEIDLSCACYNNYGNSSADKPVGYYNGNQTPIGADMINGYGLYDVIGNAAEWTRSADDLPIESYELMETLDSARNRADGSHECILRGWGKSGCYYRCGSRLEETRGMGPSSYSGCYTYFGFRVARRSTKDVSSAKLVGVIDFNAIEGESFTAVQRDFCTLQLESGVASLANEDEDSDGRCLRVGGNTVKIGISKLNGRLGYVRFRMKGDGNIWLVSTFADGTTWSQSATVATVWIERSLMACGNAVSCYFELQGYSDRYPLYVDDIELFVIPE